MIINKHYIVFIWIILLIIFTFYCIFRIKYIREKYIDVMEKTQQSVVLITKQSFDKSTPSASAVQLPTTTESSEFLEPTESPITTQSQDIFTYINNLQTYNNITDIPNCENMYDDNYGVQDLGYNNCSSAYADYLDKNLDINNKYGKNNSLATMCPASSRTPKYNKCSEILLTKFADNNTILNNINKDMTSSLNKRIDARSSILTGTQIDTKSFISDKNQIDFNNDMLVNGNIPNYPDERLSLIDNYYQDKYSGNIETFTNLVDPYIENNFFGKFRAVNGQFIAFTDLIFTISYDTLNDTSRSRNPSNESNLSKESEIGDISKISNLFGSQPNNPNNPTKPSILTSLASSPTNVPSTTKVSSTTKVPTTTTTSEPTNISPSLVPAINVTTKPLLFSISNNDLYITYDVVNIDFYKNSKKAIKLILNNKNILVQTASPNTTEQLLSILGLNTTSQLIFVVTSFVSTEGVKHTTYKLVNDNLDTIIVLNKI